MNKDEYLRSLGIEPTARATPKLEPKAIPNTQQPATITADSVAQMRERLEIKKLEIELSKLEKPDTSIDYYQKMLELQKENFGQVLEMVKQQGELKLEIEKLKLMGDGESDSILPYIQLLAPLLPEIIKNSPKVAKSNTKQLETASKDKGSTVDGNTVPTPETRKTRKMKKKELKDLEEYKQKIKRGEIGLEEAYSDFLKTEWGQTLTKEQFTVRFNDLKQSI